MRWFFSRLDGKQMNENECSLFSMQKESLALCLSFLLPLTTTRTTLGCTRNETALEIWSSRSGEATAGAGIDGTGIAADVDGAAAPASE